MKFASTGAAFAIFLHTELASSAPCQGSECVSLYSGAGCKSSLTNFIPTCEGNCFQMGFDSLGVSGNGFKGTDCHVYSDTNCQNQIDRLVSPGGRETVLLASMGRKNPFGVISQNRGFSSLIH